MRQINIQSITTKSIIICKNGPKNKFSIGTTVNKAAMNTGVQTYFQVSGFGFFGQILRRGITRSYGSYI